jgi:hypothetical protein
MFLCPALVRSTKQGQVCMAWHGTHPVMVVVGGGALSIYASVWVGRAAK